MLYRCAVRVNIQEHRSAVSAVVVLADSLSVLSADTGGVMKFWDAEHGTTRPLWA